MKTKFKTNMPKQQREAAELELIIDEFGQAMRNANREHVSRERQCQHDAFVSFTYNMHSVWDKYKEFCRSHPE